MNHATRLTETREEILDTIRICEEHLADSKEAKGKDLGPFAWLYTPESDAFAEAQIAFEKERLAALPLTPNPPKL